MSFIAPPICCQLFCDNQCVYLITQVKPIEHKLVLQVFDENRLTRDDFLGMAELTLINLPKEQEGRTIPTKHYILRQRRSVGNLVITFAAVRDKKSSG